MDLTYGKDEKEARSYMSSLESWKKLLGREFPLEMYGYGGLYQYQDEYRRGHDSDAALQNLLDLQLKLASLSGASSSSLTAGKKVSGHTAEERKEDQVDNAQTEAVRTKRVLSPNADDQALRKKSKLKPECDAKGGESVDESCNGDRPEVTSSSSLSDKSHSFTSSFSSQPPFEASSLASLLTGEEEVEVVNWLSCASKSGFPRSKRDLFETVNKLIGGKESVSLNGWYEQFILKYPNVPDTFVNYYTRKKEGYTRDKINLWFSCLKDYLHENSAFSALKNPERIFNICRILFHIDTESGIIKVGAYDDELQDKSILLILAISASGMVVPSTLVFPSSSVIPKGTEGAYPGGWGIKYHSEVESIESLLQDYLIEVFLPWIEQQKIKYPIVIFLDNQKWRVSNHLSLLSWRKGIVLVSVFHWLKKLYQPSNVSLLKALEVEWPRRFQKWKKADRLQTQMSFCAILMRILEQPMTVLRVRNAFRVCGLVPYDRTAIHQSLQSTAFPAASSSTSGASRGHHAAEHKPSTSDKAPPAVSLEQQLFSSSQQSYLQQLYYSQLQQLQKMSMPQNSSAWAQYLSNPYLSSLLSQIHSTDKEKHSPGP